MAARRPGACLPKTKTLTVAVGQWPCQASPGACGWRPKGQLCRWTKAIRGWYHVGAAGTIFKESAT